MANYFILQENDESVAYAFKVSFDRYRPSRRKNQREQYTVTGTLDVQVGPNHNIWQYGVKLYGDISGSFGVTPGSIMTASTVYWGDVDNLTTLFGRTIPPANKLRFRDMDGVEQYIFFTGEMKTSPLTPKITGDSAYLQVEVTMRSS